MQPQRRGSESCVGQVGLSNARVIDAPASRPTSDASTTAPAATAAASPSRPPFARYTPWEESNTDAVLLSQYPGSMGGKAIADVLTGAYNPGGRLPFTVYTNFSSLPSLADVSMTGSPGRTYR